jgi:Transposase IS116/IS110/IS902 family
MYQRRACEGSGSSRLMVPLLEGQEALTAIVLLLLETWRSARMQAARLDRQLMASAGEHGLAADNDGSGDRRCHCPVLHKRDRVASNVDSSRAVGAYVGLKARSYQSG